MKVRIKFQKFGAMKFIGHLDVMRYFQKAFRRAGLDSEYSKGFSPHQIMSFAAPLGVGLTSDGEYVDISLLSGDTPKEMVERINAVMSEGFRVVGYHILKDREENQKAVTAMSLVSSADYLVSLKDGYTIGDQFQSSEDFRKAFQEFLEQKEIVIEKKTKKSEKAVDIRPMITMVAFDEKEYKDKLNDIMILDNINDKSEEPKSYSTQVEPRNTSNSYSIEHGSVAEQYENGMKVYLQVDTGSAANLKPELVMEAFCDYWKIPHNKFAWQVHRIEVYTREVENNKLIALDQLVQ